MQSAQVAREIIESVNKDYSVRLRYHTNEPSLVQRLQDELSIVDVLVQNLGLYSAQVRETLKSLQEI